MADLGNRKTIRFGVIMNFFRKSLFLTVCCLAGNVCVAQMNEVFVKNYHSDTIAMWVNGRLQGCIPPGKTAWIEANGFDSPNGGVQPDGSIKHFPAYGGWDRRDETEVVFAGRNPSGTIVFGKVSVPKENKRAQISFAGNPPPKDLELERAINVQQGHLNISLSDIRPASSRNFTGSPASKYASADGKVSLEIKPSMAGGYEGTLSSFGKTYPLKVAQKGGRLRLSNDEANLELEAEWVDEQLALTQGSSKKLLKDLGASVELACELAGAPGQAFADTKWKINGALYWFATNEVVYAQYSNDENRSWRNSGSWKLDKNAVTFGDWDGVDTRQSGFKAEATISGKSMKGTWTVHVPYGSVDDYSHNMGGGHSAPRKIITQEHQERSAFTGEKQDKEARK